MKSWLPFLLVACLWTNPVHAQEQSVEYVPKEAFAGALVNIEKLMKKDDSNLFPHEIISAMAVRDFGFDPGKIKSGKLIVGLNADAPAPIPSVGCVLEFSNDVNLGDMFNKLDETAEVDGTSIRFNENMGAYFVLPRRNVLLVASSEPFALLMAASKRERTPFTRLLSETRLDSDIKVIVSIEQLKPLLKRGLNMVPIMPQFADVKTLPDQIQSHSLTAILAGFGFDVTLTFHCYSEDAAKKVSRTLSKLLREARKMIFSQLDEEMGNSDDPVQKASMAYMKRVLGSFETSFLPKQKGKDVSIKLKNDTVSIAMMTGLLLPAIQSARGAARRVQSANNLKQVGLAFHNYHDTRKRFPAQAIVDKKGRPLLSWRVEVLPYLGYEDLYDQFKLDEPWDSPHNKKLLTRMPEIFRNPNGRDGTTTNYLGISGKGTFFDGGPGKSFRDFRDGTSRTALFVESDRFVPWTKPEDHRVDLKNPLDGLGNARPGGFQIGMADGSVTFIAKTVDPEVLANLFLLDNEK